MLNLQVLISTVDERIKHIPSVLPKKMKGIGYIICHQSNGSSMEHLFTTRDDINYIKDNGRGLSRSRNLCIQASTAEILLIADDDVIYEDNFASTIINAFNASPKADIICFQARITGSETLYRKYPTQKKWLKNYKKHRPSSIEIAIRNCSIRKLPKFNERFGVGAEFPIAEDSIFMIETFRTAAKVLFYPAVIVSHPYESTRLKKFTCPHTIKAIGAYYAHLYWKPIALTMITYNALKNRNKYSFNFTFIEYISYLFNGYIDYYHTHENTKSID